MASSSNTAALVRSCAGCEQREESAQQLQRCGGCKVHYYCGRPCQVSHWKEHKKVCKQWATLKAASEKWHSLDADPGILKRRYPGIVMVRDIWEKFNGEDRGTCPHVLVEKFLSNDPKGKTAADLGCGIGYQAHRLLESGFQVKAVDISPTGLKVVQGRHPMETLMGRLSVQQSTVEKADYSEMDVIVANDILPYTNPGQLRQLLEKIHRSLNPGGQFFASFFLEAAPQDLKIIWTLMGAWYVKNSATAKSLLESVGFTKVNVIPRPNSDGAAIEFQATKS